MSRHQINSFYIDGDSALIDVSTKALPDTYTIIDASDLLLVLNGNGRWYADKGDRMTYVRRRGAGGLIRLHRYILGLDGGRSPLVDHRDREGLNNRRANLRTTGSQGNRANASGWAGTGLKGVYKVRQKYRAMIGVDGKLQHLGMFDDLISAARAYDAAALQHFGEYALTNFAQEKNR